MRLLTFGKVQLVGCTFSRPKPLLLLAYLTLEGPQERRSLAALFWRDPDPQKRLAKLSVVLAQLKKEGAGAVLAAPPGADPIGSCAPCDALEFRAALAAGDAAWAVALYRGPFLGSLERSLPGLALPGELADWLLETRETLAGAAQGAMVGLAERAFEAGELTAARALAERAYALTEAPEPEPERLSRLQRLLTETRSPLARGVLRTAAAGLEELPEAARRVFLALALQDVPNLTVLRRALELSLHGLSDALEVLLGAGLVTPEARLLAPESARRALESHPREAVGLLLALARATPAEDALGLYRRLYAQTQGFGGVGDLLRARAAYCSGAKAHLGAQRFAEAAALLSELHAVERVLAVDPDPESRFLEAYALERMGRYKEALATLAAVPEAHHTPDLTALRSVLLWRRGRSGEAARAAEKALASGLDGLWARATAHTTLGYLAYAGGRFLEASSCFKKAATLFRAGGEEARAVGALNNHANALDTLAETSERRGEDVAAVGRLRAEAEAAYCEALAELERLGGGEALRARILLNLGLLWEYRGAWEEARRYYGLALPLAERVNDLELMARLQLNLAGAQAMGGSPAEAKVRYAQAAKLAAQAGDALIQGTAMANLASMDERPDLDGMEVALELLERSGNVEQLRYFEGSFETMVRAAFRTAVARGEGERARSLLLKLGALYGKQHQPDKAGRVETALGLLTSSGDTEERNVLLQALFEDAGRAPSPN